MDRDGKVLILTAIDVFSGLHPIIGGVLQTLKPKIEIMYEVSEKDLFDIGEIDRESVAALEMVQKVKGSSETISSDAIYIEFSRVLDKSECNEFFDEQAIVEAYSDCSVTMKNLEMDDDWDGIRVFFEDEVSELEIAKFAVFIDRYIKKLGEDLFVSTVYV